MKDTVSKEKRREISRRSRLKNKEHHTAYNAERLWQIREHNYELYMIGRIRQNAKKTGHIVTITEDDLDVPEFCPVLGIRLDKHATKETRSTAPSVDRIDNNIGYVPGNIVIVSLKANRIKNDATVEELEKVLNFYKEIQT